MARVLHELEKMHIKHPAQRLACARCTVSGRDDGGSGERDFRSGGGCHAWNAGSDTVWRTAERKATAVVSEALIMVKYDKTLAFSPILFSESIFKPKLISYLGSSRLN